MSRKFKLVLVLVSMVVVVVLAMVLISAVSAPGEVKPEGIPAYSETIHYSKPTQPRATLAP